MKNLKPWVQFATLNAIAGLIMGMCLSSGSNGGEYFILTITVPLASFLTGGLFWKLLQGEKNYKGAIWAGFLTGVISHFSTWVLISIGISLCYWITGSSINLLGKPPENIISMLGQAFIFSFLTLYLLGWITISISIIFAVQLRTKFKNQDKE